jgi:RNA polymerase sigma factor (sigma-70 family)
VTDLAEPIPTDGGPAPAVDWGLLLASNEHWLRKVILARTGERQAVEEVFQRVALAAIAQRAPLADWAKAPAWLHRLAVIQSALYRRQVGRGRRALTRLADSQTGEARQGDLDGLGWLLKQERLEMAHKALADLPGKDVEVLMLKYGERWSYRQISSRLGISEKAVDCRLMRARERLRSRLRELGLEESDL